MPLIYLWSLASGLWCLSSADGPPPGTNTIEIMPLIYSMSRSQLPENVANWCTFRIRVIPSRSGHHVRIWRSETKIGTRLDEPRFWILMPSNRWQRRGRLCRMHNVREKERRALHTNMSTDFLLALPMSCPCEDKKLAFRHFGNFEHPSFVE